MVAVLNSMLAPQSARKRVLNHLFQQKQKVLAANVGDDPDPDPDPNAPKGLDPGMMQLKSFYGESSLVSNFNPNRQY
jgi:hypothetical protein